MDYEMEAGVSKLGYGCFSSVTEYYRHAACNVAGLWDILNLAWC